jgi:hypothetical protein
MEQNVFVTDNLSLCGFLEIRGLKFLKAELSQGRNSKIKVYFHFLDPDDRGRDLEIEYRFSSEKKYKDSLFYYRKIINDLLGT